MLKNQKILAVGATSAIATEFCRQALQQGAHCASVSRTDPSIDIPNFKADITDLRSFEAGFQAAYEVFGNIDTVINFAGTHHKPMDFALQDPEHLYEEFQRVMNVNLNGAFIVTMIAAKKLIAQRHGHILHLCSNASRLSLYGSYAYNASKHGLEGLIKTAAAQLAPFHVRVNGVAPGTVETQLNRHLLRGSDGVSYSPRAASILAHTPSKRFASLEGVAETLLAACIPQRHLTGNVIFCDDGYNIEGHSWPEGNKALFNADRGVDEAYEQLDRVYTKS
jgi:3-oxoacyl-[acyl-carrier protein] reductase